MYCCCSVAKLCLILCNLRGCNTPGFPVPYHLPEFAQVHVHWISDAIQPSHPLSPSFPFAFNLSQHHGLFQWVSYSHQVAKSWSISFSISPSNEYSGFISLGLTGLTSLLSKGLPRVFSSTRVWKYQFFGAQPSLLSSSHICHIMYMCVCVCVCLHSLYYTHMYIHIYVDILNINLCII